MVRIAGSGPTLPSDDKWGHIYRRDRWRCSNPVCNRRDVTPHHLKFQSHGGGHEDANLVSLCAECHLFGVHEGRLSVSPPAVAMVWHLGRTPILEVRGRERIGARSAPDRERDRGGAGAIGVARTASA